MFEEGFWPTPVHCLLSRGTMQTLQDFTSLRLRCMFSVSVVLPAIRLLLSLGWHDSLVGRAVLCRSTVLSLTSSTALLSFVCGEEVGRDGTDFVDKSAL